MINTKFITDKVEGMIKGKAPKPKIYHEVAMWFIAKFEFRSIIGTAKKDPMYVYEGGIFEDKGEILVGRYCEKILQDYADNNSVNQIIQKVRRLTEFDRHNLGCQNLDLICLNNCVLNIRSREQFEHDPKYCFISKMDIDYDEDADCPKFKTFLDEVMYPEDISTCQQWFGFMLYRKYFEKSSLVLIGPKDSGKTVLLNVMKAFISPRNTSSIDLHDMIINRFATNGLFNMMLNTNDELDGSDLRNTALYKKLVGGGSLHAEAKNQTPYDFVNVAKLVFATNQMPLPDKLDDPSSYYNKFITFEFDNTFAKDDPRTDKFLFEKLTKKKEIAGILNWALDGINGLLKKKKFDKCQNWRDVEKIMKRVGRDIDQFVNQCCEECTGNLVSKEEMYESYCDFCRLNDKIIEYSLSGFGRKFRPSYVVNKNSGPRKYMGWMNVKLKKENLLLL